MPLLAVDDVSDPRGRFDHQCKTCGVVRRGLRLASDLSVFVPPLRHRVPGECVLVFDCPSCKAAGVRDGHSGTQESFFTDLRAEDEDETREGNYAYRAQQARLIRAAQRHPHIGLPTIEEHEAAQAAQQ